jgi:hypothetical protein
MISTVYPLTFGLTLYFPLQVETSLKNIYTYKVKNDMMKEV